MTPRTAQTTDASVVFAQCPRPMRGRSRGARSRNLPWLLSHVSPTAMLNRSLAGVVATAIVLGGFGMASASPRRATAASVAKTRSMRWLSSIENESAPPARLASHVPLAVVRHGRVQQFGKEACKQWGPVGSRWISVDMFGEPIRTAKVAARDYYDYSKCFELALKRNPDAREVGLFVSANSGYRPPSSARWEPSTEALASFARFMDQVHASLEKAERTDDKGLLPLSRRSIFFEVKRPAGEAPVHFAVGGGRVCVVARWAPGGHWEQVYIERGYLENGPTNACLPRAVLDMDGDGVPEVVYYGTEREWWGYNVARLGADGVHWTRASQGHFGSTA